MPGKGQVPAAARAGPRPMEVKVNSRDSAEEGAKPPLAQTRSGRHAL